MEAVSVGLGVKVKTPAEALSDYTYFRRTLKLFCQDGKAEGWELDWAIQDAADAEKVCLDMGCTAEQIAKAGDV